MPDGAYRAAHVRHQRTQARLAERLNVRGVTQPLQVVELRRFVRFLGQTELADHQPSTRPEDAGHLGQAGRGLREVMDTEAAGHDREGGVPERQPRGVGTGKLHAALRRVGCARPAVLGSALQHRQGEVYADDTPLPANARRQLKGHRSGPRGHVERDRRGGQRRKLDHRRQSLIPGALVGGRAGGKVLLNILG